MAEVCQLYVMLGRGVFPRGREPRFFCVCGSWLVVVTRCKKQPITIMSKKATNRRGMEESILEEAFHLGHSPEKWQPVPVEDYHGRALAWLRLFWTCWRQMEPHVPAILERHPEICECDCSCMRHIGRPWGPLSLSPVLVGWTSPESPWLRRGEDGRVQHLFYALYGAAPCCGASLEVEMETGRTCLRRPASSHTVLPEHLRVRCRAVYRPGTVRNMSLMELAGHFLPHPPVVAQVISEPAQPEPHLHLAGLLPAVPSVVTGNPERAAAHLHLAGLLPAVPGVVTGDPERVAAHLHTSLEFHNSARLLTLQGVSGEDQPDVCIGFNPSHIAPGLDDILRALCAAHGFPCRVKAMFHGVPQDFQDDSRVVSVHLYIRRDLYLDESTHAKKPEGFRRLQSLVLECAKAMHGIYN